ncbi:hypothetical protein MMC10_009496 [Thelotrema lepadinum]|nr:hypothetical protein [Thelotrema lepadinum]
MAQHAVAPIFSLPAELLHIVLDYAASPTPSSIRQHWKPSFEFTDSKNTPLKRLSLTCKTMRAFIAPRLFRSARFKIRPVPSGVPPVIRYRHLQGPTVRWKDEKERMMGFLNRSNLAGDVRSITVLIQAAEDCGDYFRHFRVELYKLWPEESVFPRFEQLNIVAQSSALRALLSLDHVFGDYHDRQSPYHLLSLCRSPDTHDRNEAIIAAGGRRRERMWQWDSILLNEGSSTFLRNRDPSNDDHLQQILAIADVRKPPSILLNNYPILLRRARTFTYSALFPFHSHLKHIIGLVVQNTNCLRLRTMPV